MSVSSTKVVMAHRHRPRYDDSRPLPAAMRRIEDCRGTCLVRRPKEFACQVDRVSRYERHSRRDLQCTSLSPGAQLPESPLRHCRRTVLLRLLGTAAPKWFQSKQESSFLPPSMPLTNQTPLSPVFVAGDSRAHRCRRNGNTASRIVPNSVFRLRHGPSVSGRGAGHDHLFVGSHAGDPETDRGLGGAREEPDQRRRQPCQEIARRSGPPGDRRCADPLVA